MLSSSVHHHSPFSFLVFALIFLSALCTPSFGQAQYVNPGQVGLIQNGNGSSPSLRSPQSVYVAGNYAYVASSEDNTLEIVDITMPDDPVHKGSLANGTGGAFLENPSSVFVSGNYAYVTVSPATLEIIDISDPIHPLHKGSLAHPDFDHASSVSVSGNYAYVHLMTSELIASGGMIEIVDVSNPAHPVLKGILNTGAGGGLMNTPLSINVAQNYAYVTTVFQPDTNNGSGTLEIVDISNPASPVYKGSLSDGQGGAMLNSPGYVVLSGHYAYVTNLGSIEIIDVTNPESPAHISTIINGNGGASLTHPTSLFVTGNYAYVTNLDSTLEIVDISNPASPAHMGSLTNGTDGALLSAPTSIYVSGMYAYVTSSGNNALEIVDVSNPTSPAHMGSLSDGPGGALLNSPTSVYVSGNYAYVTSFTNDGGTLEIVDISNQESPQHKSSLTDGVDRALLHSPTSVFVSGNYAFVTSRNNLGTLEIIDISNPVSPLHTGSLSDGQGGALLHSPTAVFVSGNYAYVTSSVRNALEIVDVSNPFNPVHKGALSEGTGGAILSSPTSVYVSGHYAYVTGLGNALEIVDISNPANPVHKSSVIDGQGGAILAYPTSVHVTGNYAYVTAHGNGLGALEVINISNPANPVHAGSLTHGTGGALLSSPTAVYVSRNFAFVTSGGSNALEIVDISNPATPAHKASLEDGNKPDGAAYLFSPRSVYVVGNYSYVTSDDGLSIIFNYAPILSGFSPSCGAAGTSVIIAGQNFNTFVSCTLNGMQVPITSVTSTTLTLKIPEDATIGPIVVLKYGDKETNGLDFMVIPSVSNTSNIQQTSFTANWSDVGVGTYSTGSYYLDVSTDQFITFVSSFNNQAVGNVTSFNVTGLQPGTPYYYRVRSSNGANASCNSNTQTLLTLPANSLALHATSLHQTSFIANWTSVPGATGYYLDVAADSSFNKFLNSYHNLYLSGQTDTTEVISGLSPFTPYYYRVRTANISGSSSSSNVIRTLTLDITPPAISLALFPNPTTITNGFSPVFSAWVTDNVQVDTVKIFYRGIAQPYFQTAGMEGPGGEGGNYTITIESEWADSLGMEYYFLAMDAAGNQTLSKHEYLQLITSSISLPQLPTGTDPSDYRIIAFPYHLRNNNDIPTVYDGVPWNDNSKAALWWWNPMLHDNSGGYDQYGPKSTLQTVDEGKGYWVVVANPISPQLSNVPAPTYNQSNLYSMKLKPGWNQIGNPYPSAISWDDVVALNLKINPDALFSPLNIYQGEGYMQATGSTLLKPFEGGFVKNLGYSDITVQIPFAGQTSIAGRDTHHSPTSDISSDEWNVFLHISQNGMNNRLGGVGMHPHARAGQDRFDNFNPPTFLDIPALNFEEAEYPDHPFSNDIVKSQEAYTWQFTPSGLAGKSAQLTWSTDIYGTQYKQLFLLDEELVKVIDMTEKSSYEFVLTAASRFRVFYGTGIQDKVTSTKVLASAPYPNPLSIDGRSTINLALPDLYSIYSVRLEIFNGQGETILSESHTLSTGIHPLAFSLTENSYASGIYIYKVSISSPHSSSFHMGKIIKP